MSGTKQMANGSLGVSRCRAVGYTSLLRNGVITRRPQLDLNFTAIIHLRYSLPIASFT